MTSMSRKTETRDRKAKRASARRRKRKVANTATQNSTFKAMPLEKYAEIKKMPPFLIWEEIKKGKIIARQINGEVYILPSNNSSESISDKRVGATSGSNSISFSEIASGKNHGGNTKEKIRRSGASSAPSNEASLPNLPQAKEEFLGLDGNPSNSPEVALLLDHLSLAKEENKEILQMAQKSLDQVKEITREIVATKDSLLEAKEEKIKLLEEKLAAKDKDLNKTKQSLEDLEMLTRTLTTKK